MNDLEIETTKVIKLGGQQATITKTRGGMWSATFQGAVKTMVCFSEYDAVNDLSVYLRELSRLLAVEAERIKRDER